MSIFDYVFDNDWFQRADINRLDEKAEAIEARIGQSSAQTQDLGQQIRELRKDVSRMLLLVETTHRILLDKRVCTPEEFTRMMKSVDAEDGLEDGQLNSGQGASEELRYCNGCKHFNPAARAKCQYCGAAFGSRG